MKRLITALFTSTLHADRAVTALKNEGFYEDDMSVISKDNFPGNEMFIGAAYAAATNEDVTSGITAGNIITGTPGIFMGFGESSASPIASFYPPYSENVQKTLSELGVASDAAKKLEKEVKNNKTLFYIEANENDIDKIMFQLQANGAERAEIH